MCPERARVLLIEDDDEIAGVTTQLLELAEHKVLLRADTVEGALQAVLQARDKGVNVALVDGNLSRDRKDGSDGALITDELRQQYKDDLTAITIIEFTNGRPRGYGHYVPKEANIGQIGKIVTEL